MRRSILILAFIFPLAIALAEPCSKGGEHDFGDWGKWARSWQDFDGINCRFWRIRNCKKCNTSRSEHKKAKCSDPPSDC